MTNLPVVQDLSGRVAIVTGAMGGVGRATVDHLRKRGARVVAEDISPSIADLASPDVIPLQGDVRAAATAERAVALALERLGGLDILVNNAAIIVSKDIIATTESDWDEVMGINVKGAFLHIRAALAPMIARGRGTIVNVTSISGLVGLPQQAAYCASKGAVVQLTRQVAVEYAGVGIRVNSVAPGAIDTPFLERHLRAQPDRTKALNEVNAAHPLGRPAAAGEIAATIGFLCSDASSYITGAILAADGGYTSR